MDSATGVIRVRRVVVAHDCGLVVNPDGLRNQIEGNVVQGISRTLKEEVHHDSRGVTSVLWQQNKDNPTPQYSVLRFSEVPEIETILIDRAERADVGRWRADHRHAAGGNRQRRVRRDRRAHQDAADDADPRARRAESVRLTPAASA